MREETSSYSRRQVLSAGAAGATGVVVSSALAAEAGGVTETTPVGLGEPVGPAAGQVVAADGRLFLRQDPRVGETYGQVLGRHGRPVDASGTTEHVVYSHSYGAVFAEVRVDPTTGETRVTRLAGAFDVGRVINPKTARSQATGGMIWGLGTALTEHTLVDRNLGRIVTANLSGYLVPVHADVPDIDVTFVDKADPEAGVLGARGMGELSANGTTAAIANAVCHATGRRVRDLPITPDKLL